MKHLPKKLLVFGLPLVVGMALQACFNLVDMIIVGFLPNGTVAISVLAICDIVVLVPTIIGTSVTNASAAVISRRFGEGDKEKADRCIFYSLSINLLISIFFGIVGLLLARFYIGDIMGLKGSALPLAVDYFQILVGGCFSIILLLYITNVLRSIGNSFWPGAILIIANVLNIFLDIFLVFGKGPTPEIFGWASGIAGWAGIPRMEVSGAAWATVISRLIGVGIGFGVLFVIKNRPRFKWRSFVFNRTEIKNIISISWPSCGQYMVRIISTLVFISLITRFYTTPDNLTVLAAFGICVRLDTLALFAGLGWGAAASTFIGQNLGAGLPKQAVRAGWIAAGYNVVFMIVVASLYIIFSPEIITLFNGDSEVIRVGQQYLRIVGLSYVFIGIAAVLGSGISGAGATLSVFAIDSVILLGIQVPIGFISIVFYSVPVVVAWIIIASGNFLSAVMYSYWYKMGYWQRRKV